MNETLLEKKAFMKILSEAVMREDEMVMKKEIKSLKKTSALINDDVRLKNYMKMKNVSSTREIFRIKTNMNKIRGNYKNDFNMVKDGVMCVGCGKVEEVNSHLVTCQAYEDLRTGG